MRYVHLLPRPGMAKTTLLAGVLMAFAPGIVSAEPVERNGTIPYVAHLVFRPLFSSDVARLATAASLEKLPAHCTAVERFVGEDEILTSVCEVTDGAGDKVFSSFEARDIDRAQPKMVCGTHIIAGGTGKYKRVAEGKPFICVAMPALVGPSVETAMAKTREIK